MKKLAALSLLLLAAGFIGGCASSGTAPTPTASVNEADAAFFAGIAACGEYVRHHPGSGPLVASRVGKVQAALDAQSVWGTIRTLVLDSVTDPLDAAALAVVLRIADRNAPVAASPVVKGSQACIVIQGGIDGCLSGVAAGGGR